MVFKYNFVVAKDTIISLHFVETCKFIDGEEEAVVDKLRNDAHLSLTTVSGATYILSMNELIISLKIEKVTTYEQKLAIRAAIIDKWIQLFSDKD